MRLEFKTPLLQFLFVVALALAHPLAFAGSSHTQEQCIEQWNRDLSFDLEVNGVFKFVSSQVPLQLKRLSVSREEPWSIDLSKDRLRIASEVTTSDPACREFGEKLVTELDRIREARFQYLLEIRNYIALVEEAQALLASVFGTDKERSVLVELEPYAREYFHQLDADVRKMLQDKRLEKSALQSLSQTPSKIVIWTKNWSRFSPERPPKAESHADTQEVGLKPWGFLVDRQRLLYVHELAHLQYAYSHAGNDFNLYDAEAYAWLRTFEMMSFAAAQKRALPPLFMTILSSARADCDSVAFTCKETPAYRTWIKFVVDSNYFE